MLFIPALWTSTLARIMDTSLRYTVDKTTREILFVPLPTSLKCKAKPFADVAVDRFAKGVGAAVALIIAIKVFHLELVATELPESRGWRPLGFHTPFARGRVPAGRSGTASRTREVQPADLRLNVRAISPRSKPWSRSSRIRIPKRVVYAIDVLESARQAQSRHAAASLSRVRRSYGGARWRRWPPSAATSRRQWAPHIRRMLGDPDSGVRAGAIGALAAVSDEDASTLARPLLQDPDPRIRATAAVALAQSSRSGDVDKAEAALVDLISNTARFQPKEARKDVAIAIRQITDPRFKRLLIPLLYDPATVRRRRGDGECARRGRQRLHLRPDAGVAAAKPPAQGPSAGGVGRLRRRRGRTARLLPQGSGGRHLGPSSHPWHARADSIAEERRCADCGARRERRLHPLQGRVGARTATA